MAEEKTMKLINEKDSPIVESLEKRNNWDGTKMHKFQDFWCPFYLINSVQYFQQNFKAHHDHIMFSSVPKSGTTWMKALLFSIINRKDFPIDQIPLLTSSSHKLVSNMECGFYFDQENSDLESMHRPRLFTTHLPYQVLSKSLIDSKSNIVYICRNPLDQFISERCFLMKNPFFPESSGDGVLPTEEAFDMVCEGVQAFGPYWDHLLGYWKASLENPDRVLFLKYEDMEKDPVFHVKKIAEFVNLPFSEQEERQGLVEEIKRLCSFDKLKNLEINKTCVHHKHVMNSSFYRKGQVGDWKNHLKIENAERMRKILDEKLRGSRGLIIDI